MKEFEICMLEHKGKENAVNSRKLEKQFHLKGSEIRHMVNVLRCNGVPICSCNRGYYYAECAEDIESTLAHLESRIKKIRDAQNGMRDVLTKYKEGN